MKTKSLCLTLGRATALLSGVIFCPGMAWAQQQPPPRYDYAPQYEAPAYPEYPQGPRYAEPPDRYAPEFVPPHQFFKLFGRRFGEMFRGLFYGDDPPPGYAPHLPGGRSLDEAPPAYGSHYGPSTGLTVPPNYDPSYPPRYGTQPPPRYDNAAPGYEAPRYETPAGPEAPRYETPPPVVPDRRSLNSLPPPKTSSPAGKPKADSAPPKKYVPPTITRTPPGQPKLESQPPTPAPATASKTIAEKPPSSPSAASKSSSGVKSTTAGAGNTGSFLKGKRTGKAGRVTSPYPPYQELDVTGLASGSLALDPTTQKVFEVP